MMSRMEIPHILHYCWFGKSEKPKNIVKYVEAWKKLLPDYIVLEWNEDNFNILDAPTYVQEAYNVHKYAFVSDYVRIKVLVEHGGVYLDTDIEIVRRFDKVLEGRELVLGFESDKSLETAFIACSKGNSIIQNFLESYDGRRFILPDGTYDMSVINEHFSRHMQDYGVDLCDESYREIPEYRLAIYPREYFAAYDIGNWHIKPTENTFTIHHMNASWSSGKKKVYFGVIKILQRILGFNGYDKLKKSLDKMRGKNATVK